MIIKVRLKSGNLARVQIVRPTGPTGPDGAVTFIYFCPELLLPTQHWASIELLVSVNIKQLFYNIEF